MEAKTGRQKSSLAEHCRYSITIEYKPYDGRSRSLGFSLGLFRELGLAVDDTAPVVVLDSRFQALSAFDVFGAHLEKGRIFKSQKTALD